jgi:hypothetical protein
VNSDNKDNSARKAEKNSDLPTDWSRVEIDDGITFDVPAVLRPAATYQTTGNWRFRSPDMEILINYDSAEKVVACEIQKAHASRIKVEPISIDRKEAQVEWLEKTAFNLEDDASMAVKGFAICVPNVGDNVHSFSAVGKYRSAEDYRTLSRVLGSIRFSK